jgi:predicted metal-dependent HD superfamily phosphohydrolase
MKSKSRCATAHATEEEFIFIREKQALFKEVRVMNMQALSDRWIALWQRIGGRGDPLIPFNDLVQRYSETHRAYHTLDHIKQCLDELDDAQAWINSIHMVRLAVLVSTYAGYSSEDCLHLDVIELALWYHDSVYEPRAQDNEEKSSKLAKDVLKQTSLKGWAEELVVDSIMATKYDFSRPHPAPNRAIQALVGIQDSLMPYRTADERSLVEDIDLSILGSAPKIFDDYEKNIRKEYMSVSEDDFRTGRMAILESFLNQNRIYKTTFFHRKYEATARENLKRSIEMLEAKQLEVGG